MKILVVCSTGGGVLSKVLQIPYFKDKVKLIVTDRECGVIDVAKENNIECSILYSKTGSEFSDKLNDKVQLKDYDLLISFYTRLFSGKILQIMKGKIINLHPSILPACPGLNGFEDTINSRSRFIGATIHFIDEGIDTGTPIIQSATPYNLLKTLEQNRHKVFVDQCRMLLQTVKWFDESRIEINGKDVVIVGAKFNINQYSPNLDYDEAKKFNVNYK